MWETTFPINSHAGLGRDFTNMFHTREYVFFVKRPTQSGVAIYRKCCFPLVTRDEIRIFEAFFKGVSTRFGLLTIEKLVENPDFIFCSSFQNLRLGIMNFTPPKRRFWKAEQTFQNASSCDCMLTKHSHRIPAVDIK